MQYLLDLGNGHTGAYADHEFTVESLGHAGFVEQVLDHVGLAGEDDDFAFHDRGDILLLYDLEGGAVFPESLLDPFGGLGAAHAGDEAGG